MQICKARQLSDQINCAPCGLVWDVNDVDPPACPRQKVDHDNHDKALDDINKILSK